MSTQSQSRHIPNKVVSKLLEDSRYRCCVCRVLIDPEKYDPEALFGSMEKHHIVHFSEGGGHTYDNLLLVCANCHTQIHNHPEKYPVDELREKKRHWVRMKDIVPSGLRMIAGSDDGIQVPFSVLSLNLQYSIRASPQTTVAELALFVGEKILKPLGEYDDHDNWLDPEKVGLARRSVPKKRLNSKLRLSELNLASDDVLIGRVPKIVVPVFVPGRPPEISEQEASSRERQRGRSDPLEPEMIRIPAGWFWMGEGEREHRLFLKGYWIGKYPITNAQYKRFVHAEGHRPPSHWENGAIPAGKEDHPVVYVTWHDAVAYCRWLERVAGRPYQLPSEAEWEKAARGADGRIYPWGNEFDKCNMDESGIGGTTPVGKYSPAGESRYGCADMAGNVWEWTRSLYKGYPYDPGDGPEDPEAGGVRVLRGGSFSSSRRSVRCAYRNGYGLNLLDFYVGFRLVMVSPSTLDSEPSEP